MGNSVKFWDKISARYAKQPITDEAAYQKKLAVTREYLTSGMSVLEIGCGTGLTAINHSLYVGNILAIDASSKMIAIAQAKAAKEKVGNVIFEQSTIEDLKIGTNSLDVVLALSVLHLVDERDEVIANIYKMLKPGGVFVSSTMCLGDSMMKLLKFIVPVGMFFGFMPSVKVFTANEFEASLTKAGFEIEHRWLPGKGAALFLVARKMG